VIEIWIWILFAVILERQEKYEIRMCISFSFEES
jgi:hypothetical protein